MCFQNIVNMVNMPAMSIMALGCTAAQKYLQSSKTLYSHISFLCIHQLFIKTLHSRISSLIPHFTSSQCCHPTSAPKLQLYQSLKTQGHVLLCNYFFLIVVTAKVKMVSRSKAGRLIGGYCAIRLIFPLAKNSQWCFQFFLPLYTYPTHL